MGAGQVRVALALLGTEAKETPTGGQKAAAAARALLAEQGTSWDELLNPPSEIYRPRVVRPFDGRTDR
jgi:hypothetical protein